MKSATIKKDIGKSVFLKSLVNVPELVTDRLTPGNWETNVLCRVDGSGERFLISVGPRWFGPEKIEYDVSCAGVDPLELVHLVYMGRE